MISPSILEQLCCLSCASAGSLSAGNTHVDCTHCGASFPYVNGQYLVLLQDSEQAIAQAYREYDAYIHQQSVLAKRLQRGDVRSTYRSVDTRKGIAEGIEHNTQFIKTIQAQLAPYVKIEKLVATRESNELSYLSNFDYIRRDWSGQDGAEKEIDTICRTIGNLAELHDTDRNCAVFLGSGTARIAWELKTKFRLCFSLDNSITMVSMFAELRQRDVPLYEINYTNVLHEGNNSVPYTASLRKSSEPATGFMHFAGDARHQPFANHSVSTVFSVYFTDLLPLRILMPELKRILKPGGVFIHFGPLHYHFQDIEDMLTADEVKAAFESEGFEIVSEDLLPLSHHYSEIALNTKSYRNWIFAARKKVQAPLALSMETVLNLHQGIRYTSGGSISADKGDETSGYQITLPSGEVFSGSELILEIARRVDGQKTLAEIANDIEQEFDFQIEDKNELLNLVTTLTAGGVFRI